MQISKSHNPKGPDHDDLVARELQTQISSWSPSRGPRWNDLVERAESRGFQLFRVYALGGAAMAAVIVAAYFAIAGLGLGSFANQPVESHSNISTNR